MKECKITLGGSNYLINSNGVVSRISDDSLSGVQSLETCDAETTAKIIKIAERLMGGRFKNERM